MSTEKPFSGIPKWLHHDFLFCIAYAKPESKQEASRPFEDFGNLVTIMIHESNFHVNQNLIPLLFGIYY